MSDTPKRARKKAVRHDENTPAAAPPPAKPIRNIIIRTAEVRDATPLYDLLMRYFSDYRVFYPAPMPAPTMAWGLSVLVKGGVLLAVEEGVIIGSVGLELGQYPWAPSQNYLNGVWFYVAPEYRKGGTAGRLMFAAKETAVKLGVALRLDSIWGVEPDLQDRFRRQQGFLHMGGNHVWFPPARSDSGN